jgi:exopolysaccharide biosynthesis WecB/TagA/CpsF family protein
MTAVDEPDFGEAIRSFDIVCPDGQSVRFALNVLHHTQLADRVYGPQLMLDLCTCAAQEKIPVYLYGSYDHVVSTLGRNLKKLLPELEVVGAEEGVYRALTPAEDRSLVERINESGAGILFLGLGCPRQERFAYEHRDLIKAVQVCVGAAFDFHAGTKRMAPPWMQKAGLEWLFRLSQEPRRLGRRYLQTNTQFVLRMGHALLFPGRR